MRCTVSNSVIIKSNKQGITVILDDEIGFDELKSLVKEKFTQSSSFSVSYTHLTLPTNDSV